MKGYIVYADGHCQIEELPIPEMGEYDALVKVESCGVCNGTDMKIIHGKFKGVEQYPVVLGHEGVARVVARGTKVRHYQIGDLVLMPYIGQTPEGIGSAWGGYAEYNLVTDARAMEEDGQIPEEYMYAQNVLPGDFDPVSSAMIITFREVLSTMGIFGFQPNQSLVILGLGPVGLSFVQFAKFLGMGPIIAVDIQDEKLEKAQKYGADAIVNSRVRDVREVVRSHCPGGIDYALDAVGVPGFINTALEILRPGGKVCVYGISEQQHTEIDWSRCPYNWTLQFNQFPSKKRESEAHSRIVEWIRLGILNPNDYISHVFDFEEIGKAFEKIENREPMMKMVIRFK
ncbi:MAG: zinc-binding dehydrogenase [Planctomycetia bacterium]|nr:zinc-binding dehydrogenase [Planctomycetia bacterium]